MVSNIPKIAVEEEESITYFINLVDVLYDARVKSILSAATPVDDIYSEGKKAFAFQRTKSRLFAMQAEEYLHAPHE